MLAQEDASSWADIIRKPLPTLIPLKMSYLSAALDTTVEIAV